MLDNVDFDPDNACQHGITHGEVMNGALDGDDECTETSIKNVFRGLDDYRLCAWKTLIEAEVSKRGLPAPNLPKSDTGLKNRSGDVELAANAARTQCHGCLAHASERASHVRYTSDAVPVGLWNRTCRLCTDRNKPLSQQPCDECFPNRERPHFNRVL